MPPKRTITAAFLVVWLSLDLAAEVARLIACQASPNAAAIALCSQPVGPAGTVLEKVRRLNEGMNLPEPAVPVPPPPPPVPSENQLDRLRKAPTL